MLSDSKTISGLDRLSKMLGMSIEELENFSPQYKHGVIAKRSGGKRLIQMPNEQTKRLQRTLLDKLIARYKVHPSCRGFSRGSSVVTNAAAHIGRSTIIKLDITDFFPNTSVARIREFFLKTGWDVAAANVLTKIVGFDEGLPQGAPTSPGVSNIVNRFMDLRLNALAQSRGMTYTRYADDLTFSCATYSRQNIHKLLRTTGVILKGFGYSLNTKKKRIIRNHRRQTVTGIVVNERLNLARPTRRWLRAVHHRLESGTGSTLSHAEFTGWVSYLRMVNPDDPLVHRVLRDNVESGRQKKRRQGTRQSVPDAAKNTISDNGLFNSIRHVPFRPVNARSTNTLSEMQVPVKSNAVTPSEYFSAQLFYNLGKDATAVARKRKLKVKTVWKHLARAVEHSLVDCQDLIPKQLLVTILTAIRQATTTELPSVGDTYRLCNGEIGYNQIRVGLAECIRRKTDSLVHHGNTQLLKLLKMIANTGHGIIEPVIGKTLTFDCVATGVAAPQAESLSEDYAKGRQIKVEVACRSDIAALVYSPARLNKDIDSLKARQKFLVRASIHGIDEQTGQLQLVAKSLTLRS